MYLDIALCCGACAGRIGAGHNTQQLTERFFVCGVFLMEYGFLPGLEANSNVCAVALRITVGKGEGFVWYFVYHIEARFGLWYEILFHAYNEAFILSDFEQGPGAMFHSIKTFCSIHNNSSFNQPYLRILKLRSLYIM